MSSIRLLVFVVLRISIEINAEKVDLSEIFETPKKNYDDLEILERSAFESDDAKPPGQPNNSIKDEPKAIANAQVLLTFPPERSWSKLSHNHLPIIETRNFLGHDVLCPQYPYRYPPIYHPHHTEPYFYGSDDYYHLPPYGYNPTPYPRIPPSNSIPKEAPTECPRIATTPTPICTSEICTSAKPTTTSPCQRKEEKKCCIYEDLLAIIEKMVQYLLQDSPSCNIKFSDNEKLKIAEALNIIIKYLNMKCRNVDGDIQHCRNKELNVEVSLILEDILSMLPITLLQAKCGKLELGDQLCCLLNIVKYIRENYGHIRGLCSIYKNLKEMFKPCIFVRDCNSNNFLSKENIRGYLLMDSLNLALYLIYKNNVNENLCEKKNEMLELWVDYLYRTQFLNCNEVCSPKVPLLNDVKSTEVLLTKLRKLFLYEYVLRLREKDPEIRGVDSIIEFCTKNCTCTFGIQGEQITGLAGELNGNQITLGELLSLVENHLKGKYNFKPAKQCISCSCPLKLTVNEEDRSPNILRSICHQPCESVDPICPANLETPTCLKSTYKSTNLEEEIPPICQDFSSDFGSEAPSCSNPTYPSPNLGLDIPICSKPNYPPQTSQENFDQEKPTFFNPMYSQPNLGEEVPSCLDPQTSICSESSQVSPNLAPEAPSCSNPTCPSLNWVPEAPSCSKPICSSPNLGPEAPSCSKPICSSPNWIPESPSCSKPMHPSPNLGPEAPSSSKSTYSSSNFGMDIPICPKQISQENFDPEVPTLPDPIYSPPNLGEDIPSCLNPHTPTCQESSQISPNLDPEHPSCSKPICPSPNLRPEIPTCSKPMYPPLNLRPEAPSCSKPTYQFPNLAPPCFKPNEPNFPPINLGPDARVCPQSPFRPPNYGPICFKPHRPQRPFPQMDLGPDAPICPDLPISSQLNSSIQAPEFNPESLYASPNFGPPSHQVPIRHPCGRPRRPINPNFRPIPPPCPESIESCEIDLNNPENLCPEIFPAADDQIRNCTTNLQPIERPSTDPVVPTCSKQPNSIQASLASDLGCVIEDPVDLGNKLCNLDNAGIDCPKPPATDAKVCPPSKFPPPKFCSDHPGRGYNILTSSEPVRCLSCGGGGGCGKFPLDMDAFNGPGPNRPGNDFGQSKDGGCGVPAPNGRRCPFCTPYIRELNY